MVFVKFPKIKDFRNVITSIQRRGTFTGLDDNGEPIYNTGLPLPTVKFVGTVKMHGTNSAVSKDLKTGELQAQSRNRVLAKGDDNAGFNAFMESVPREVWDYIFDVALAPFIEPKYSDSQITIFGEWIGPGVQHGVGISQISKKSFVAFGAYIGNRGGNDNDGYFVSLIDFPSFNIDMLSANSIYLITDLAPIHEVDIDFNHPQLIQNKLAELTIAIEDSCPVAKAFGITGIGEGIVWTPVTDGWTDSDYWFKTKGEKHSASNVKTIAQVDTTKVEGVIAFVEYAITERRLEQGIEYLKEFNIDVSKASTGEFIRWIVNDIISEESAVMDESGLTAKDIGGPIGIRARQWFFKKLSEV